MADCGIDGNATSESNGKGRYIEVILGKVKPGINQNMKQTIGVNQLTGFAALLLKHSASCF